MKVTKDSIHSAASLLGKLGWKARIKMYGMEELQERMRKVGKDSPGRPRLPDHQVKPNTLYQRERRARLKAEAKLSQGEE
jgi:hypothetical protein